MIKCKKHYGFTFVEVVLVMALIGFLYIITTKVIEHNLEQKVPLYVYNLYKNLDNESKLLTKKLLSDANGTQEGGENSSNGDSGDNEGDLGSTTGGNGSSGSNNKTIEDVLKGIDAKGYCEAFAKDANLMGDEIDCTDSSSEENIGEVNSDQIINFKCSRNESITFGYDNNTYKINHTGSSNLDSTKEQCSQNKIGNEDGVISCNAKPTKKIDDLLIDNTQSNYTYTCQVEGGSSSGSNSQIANIVSNYNVDEKIEIPGYLKTTNNIHLFFKTLYAIEIIKGQYNLNVKLNREEICPTLNTLSSNLTTNDAQCSITCTYKIDNSSTNSNFKKRNCEANATVSANTLTCTPYVRAYVYHTNNKKWIDALTNSQESSFQSQTASVTATTSMTNNCNGYLTYAQNVINDVYNKSSAAVTKNVAASYGGSCSDHPSAICSPHTRNVYMSLTANIILSNTTKAPYIEYYNKWNNFFNDYASLFPSRQKINAILDKEFDEGTILGTENLSSSNEDGKQHLAHLIYASIDMPFVNGEIGKNIFVFEHFYDKIIPVGYLANNEDTPLKFNVITRNPNTFKIEKINDKPLTYCEAMKYTGEKFSQYCGCKDENNNIVTQYTKVEACDNNFGCMIKPIQPSNVTPKFKLF